MEIKVGDEVRLNQYALKVNHLGTSNKWLLKEQIGKTREVIYGSIPSVSNIVGLRVGRFRVIWVHESQLEKKITLDNGKTIYVSLSNKR